MKKSQKITTVFILCMMLLSCIGCSIDPLRMDKKLVKDDSGNIYIINAGVGNTYFLTKIDTTEIDKINNFRNAR